MVVVGMLLSCSAPLLLPQKVDDDAILRAMKDELERSRQLRIIGGGDDVPYFFSYDLTDVNELSIGAVMGSPISVTRTRFRAPQVDVRVGSYEFDNTNHIFSGRYTGTRFDTAFPLDDSYPALRDALWLATDTAFKTAIESMSRKRAALDAAASQTEKLPDFSHADPVKSLGKLTHRKVDDAAWTARAVKLSAIFNGVPEVMASGVDLTILDGATYLVNNEGTELRYDDGLVQVIARAEGQAADGMIVRDAVTFQAQTPEQLMSEGEMQKATAAMADHVKALVRAPAGESFSGPVLFEPQAAAQLLAQLLGDNLRQVRKPLAEPGRNVNLIPSEFDSKIGSRILPDWMDVVDDPTQTTWQGKTLVGSYPFDIEGVPGKAVTVVEKGVLKSFLSTRQPTRNSAASNGHARLAGGYGARSATISNLFVKTSQTESTADLKQKLMAMCKERGKPYGMLVRKLDFPFSAGRGELQALAQSSSQSGGSARPISPPVMIYRVYADGREELVRGLRFRGVSTRSLRDIVAASKENALFEYVANGAPLAFLGAGGLLAPTSVVAPALLFEELELEAPQEQLPKLPVVPAPVTAASR